MTDREWVHPRQTDDEMDMTISFDTRLWYDIRRLCPSEALQLHHKVMTRMKHANDYPFQCRYEETGDSYDFRLFLSVHHDHSAPYPMRLSGLSLDAPDWLKNIVSIGKLGGYVVEVKSPPPDRILWFGVDSDGSLGAFLNFNAT